VIQVYVDLIGRQSAKS